MRRRDALLLLMITACNLPGFREERQPKPFVLGLRQVNIAAAVSLKEALLDFENYFESSHHDIDVVYTFAGSQLLATQILEEAAFDVFISADHIQMERASATARLTEPQVFAKSRLVIITPASDTAKVKTPIDLGRTGVYVALAAEAVPAGSYARLALQKLGILSQVLGNVKTHEESVRGVVGKVVSGDVDAGIVYATDVTEAVADKLRVVPFTGAEEIVPTYELAFLVDSRVREAAELVVQELYGADGIGALKRHGFTVP